jgi:ribose transport system permease protein
VDGVESRSTAESAALGVSGETGVELPEGVELGGHAGGGDGRMLALVARYGLLGVLVLIIAVFGALKPSSFLTLANLKASATIAAPLLVLSVGLTVPLSMGEFDLSIAQNTQLSAAIVVWLMSVGHVGWLGAIVLCAASAAVMGTVIGYIVVRSRVNAFIVTLGAGTIMAGVEFGIAQGATIFNGIPYQYVDIGSGYLVGIPVSVVIALVFALVAWFAMERSVAGRRMRAIGGNSEAARLCGVRVNQLRAAGFVITGLSAALAAVLITAQAASYYPNSATSQLLPAYAACFLGTTVFRPNLFEINGTLVGVVFLAVIQNGLLITGVPTWTAQLVEGALLIVAVVASKAAARNAA